MPGNYCLHCAKETDQRCSCCSFTHYCSQECQKADWHAIHRYESNVYNLGAEQSSSSSPSSEGEVKEREVKMAKEIQRERQEYSELIGKTIRVLEKAPRTKSEMNMTHEQRKRMRDSLFGITPDPMRTRQQQREKFLNDLREMASIVDRVPMMAPEGTLLWRPVVIDEEAEQAISLLFRKYDLLHIKVTYALATKRVEDAEEVSLYREQVEKFGRRIVHQILFGNLDDYERVLEIQQKALRQAMIDGTVEKMVTEAEAIVIEQCVSFILSQQREYSKGLGLPVVRNSGNDDEWERKRRREANNNAAIKEDKPEERQNVFSMEQYDKMANIALGVVDANQNTMEEQGKITPEQRDNTIEHYTSLWQSLRERIKEVATATRKRGKDFFTRVWDEISNRLGLAVNELKERLRNASIARIFCVATMTSFLLVAYGLYTYSFSPLSSINDTEKNIADAISLNNAAKASVDVATSQVIAQKASLASMTKELTDASATSYDFMAIDPENDDLNSVKNKVLIETTVGKVLNVYLGQTPTFDRHGNPDVQTRADADVVALANKLLNTEASLEDKRDYIKQIKRVITTGKKVGEGLGMTVDTKIVVEKIIGGQQDFVDKMGITLDQLSDTLDKQKESLDQANVNLFNVREKVRNTSVGAPFLMTLLKKVGQETYLDPTLIHPLAEVASDVFHVELFNIQVQACLYKIGQIEAHMHKLLEAKGVFDTHASQFSWLYAVGTSIFTVDFAYVFFHAFSCLSLLSNYLSPILTSWPVQTVLQFFGNKISDYVLNKPAEFLGYSPKPEDNERLEKLKTELLEEQGSEEKAVERALKLLNEGSLNAVEYGILIQLLYNKEAHAGNIFANQMKAIGKNWYDQGVLPVYYLSRLIGSYYLFDQYYNFFWQLFYIVQYVWACLSWAHISLAYGVVVILLFVLNKRNGGNSGEKSSEGNTVSMLGHLVSPFTTMFRLIYNHTYTSMFIVSIIYTTISWFDVGHNILKKVEMSNDNSGLNVSEKKLWEREGVKRETERLIDQQTSPVPVENNDTGINVMFQELALLARGNEEEIIELSKKYETLI